MIAPNPTTIPLPASHVACLFSTDRYVPNYRPRKINSIVNPHGFDFKGGKMVSLSGGQAQDDAAGTSANNSAAEDGKDDKTKKAAKAPKPNARARQGPSKKRKLAASFPDEDGNELVKEEDGQEA